MYSRHSYRRNEIRAASVRTRLTMAVVLAVSTGLALMGITSAANAATIGAPQTAYDVTALATMMVSPDLFAEPSNALTIIAMSIALIAMATGAAFFGKSVTRNIEAAGRGRIG